MSQLLPELLDADTPPDVDVRDVAAPPYPDPTLGVPLAAAAPEHEVSAGEVPGEPAYRLVTIGDSLTHGLTSGAVFHTRLSWPALAARALDIAPFDVPTYGGPLDGLPFNLEALVRQLDDAYGNDLSLLEKLTSPFVLQALVDDNEDYWERGEGAAPPRVDLHYHNLGIYGWDVRDALSFTDARAAAAAGGEHHDDLFGVKPKQDNDIAAHSVLAPFGADATQVGAAAWLGAHGGIGTLVVVLGSNNALDSVVSKRVAWSDVGFDDLDTKGAYNVWTPTHFAQEYAALVAELKAIPARRVVLATVPHVTIAPIAKGVNPDRPGEKWSEGSRYFPYYTDPWVEEFQFRADRHRHLTHQQARAIDSAIDQYNVSITDAVRGARHDGRDWLVFDLCGMLDALAFRRYRADAGATERNDMPTLVLPTPIEQLDTRMFRSNEHGRSAGGLFSLDTIHPTIVGYGLLAQGVLDVLTTAGMASTSIDFDALLRLDSLNAHPPALVDDLFAVIAPFATRFVSRRP